MEAELVRQKEAADVVKREHELALALLGQGNPDDHPHNVTERMLRMIWTHICRGSRDLQRQLSGKNRMGIEAQCSGRALEEYSRLSEEAAKDYDKVTTALMKRYDLTKDGYR